MAVDDLDAYVRWLAKQEKAFQASKKILENPGDLVTACQWLAKEKTLKEEYLRREKVVKTAVELCGESEEVQSIHKRSMQLLKAIDLYIVKVEALCVLMSEGEAVLTDTDNKVLTAVCKSGAKGGLTNEEMLEVVPEIKKAALTTH